MSLSKTSKLLQYINFRESLGSSPAPVVVGGGCLQWNLLAGSRYPLTFHTTTKIAGMRVTLSDKRQVVGR